MTAFWECTHPMIEKLGEETFTKIGREFCEERLKRASNEGSKP